MSEKLRMKETVYQYKNNRSTRKKEILEEIHKDKNCGINVAMNLFEKEVQKEEVIFQEV